MVKKLCFLFAFELITFVIYFLHIQLFSYLKKKNIGLVLLHNLVYFVVATPKVNKTWCMQTQIGGRVIKVIM